MTHRIFRVNGQVTDRIDTYIPPAAISPDETACAEVGAALNVSVAAVVAEHVESIPSVEIVITPAPAPPQPPLDAASAAEAAAMPTHPNTKLEIVRAILAKQDADITQGEMKTLVLIMARFLFKKFLAGWR